MAASSSSVPSASSRLLEDGPDEVSDDESPIDLDPVSALRSVDRLTLRDRLDDAVAQARRAPLRVVSSALVILAALAVGWWLLRPPAAPPIETTIPKAGDTGTNPSPAEPQVSVLGSATTTSGPAPELVVQAAGAVRNPGVLRVAAGSRVDDVVHAAGGLAPDADGDRVNLAAPVQDGERVWIPRVGEEDPPEVIAGSGASAPSGPDDPAGGPPGSDRSGPINLNSATEGELDELPGVGPATAAAIVAHRETNGPFSSVDQLLDVRGIGEAKLEQIRPLATV